MLEEYAIFLRPRQAAKVLNISQRTLRNWLRQGRIPYRKVGRVVLIPKKALEDWANSHTLENGSQARIVTGESDGHLNSKP
jgi:excisionase family DNA binding protein